MSGPAGSGKSTWAKQKQANSDSYYHIISSDEIRYELLGSYWLPVSEEKKVIPEMIKRARMFLLEGFGVIIDVAVCKNKSRIKWFNRLKSCGFDDVELVIIDTPVERCLAQNAQRDRKVPEDVIRQMCSLLEEPTEEMEKMFSKITIIKK